MRKCEGGDPCGKCWWGKARQPWKQGNTAESRIGAHAKVENYILFGGLDGPQAQEPACQVVLRDCSKGVREEPGFRGVFATKTR